MFTAELHGCAELIAAAEDIPNEAAAILASVYQRRAEQLCDYIRDEKLSGQVLHSISGALKDAIRSRVESDGAAVRAYVYASGVPYAAIQEYGGRTPPHEILPKSASALVFEIAGRRVFARKIEHPGSTVPARSYLNSSLDEKAPEIAADAKAALIAGLQRKVRAR